jgi:methionyl-tRNA formyltransferase
MVERNLRVVLVAEEAAGVQVLHGLLELTPAPKVSAVLTNRGSTALRRPLVYEAARKLGLETLPAELVRSPELASRLKDDGIDLLLNVHSLFLVHHDVLAAPRIGSFNLHPGPLPEYAGLNVPSWAVYNGEEMHGVSVHWMDDGIDTGPIAMTKAFDLNDSDTGLSVSAKCIRHGIPLVLGLVDTARRDPAGLPREEQDRSRRNFFAAGPPQGGRIDWARPAAEVLRFVRACDYGPFPSPWGRPRAELGGHEVGIASAAPTGARATGAAGTIHEVNEAGVVVATADELVVVQKVLLDDRFVSSVELLGD